MTETLPPVPERLPGEAIWETIPRVAKEQGRPERELWDELLRRFELPWKEAMRLKLAQDHPDYSSLRLAGAVRCEWNALKDAFRAYEVYGRFSK